MPAGDKGYTEPQRIFVTELMLNGGNKRAAYKKAFPNRKGGNRSLDTAIARMMALPHIKKTLAEANRKADQRVVKTQDKYAINKENIQRALAAGAFTNASDVMSWDGDKINVKRSDDLSAEEAAAIAEVAEVVDKAGNRSVKVKLIDKRPYLELLARTEGLLTEPEKEVPQTAIFIIETRDGKETEFAANAATQPVKQIEGKVVRK